MVVTNSNINCEHIIVLRDALKYAPSDALTLTTSINYQRRAKNDGYFWESLSDTHDSNFNVGWDQPQPSADYWGGVMPPTEKTWKVMLVN